MRVVPATWSRGLYTRNVLEQLLRLEPAVLVLAGRPELEMDSGTDLRRLPVSWRNHLWHGFRTLPASLAEVRPDVVWMPYETPLARLPVPYLMVCHDLPGEIRRAQETARGARFPILRRLRARLDDRLLERTLGNAHTVFSNSRTVAEGLISTFGVSRRKLRLAPCAPGADFDSLSRRVDAAAVRRRLGLDQGYVLTFFTGDPRENPAIVPRVYHRLVAAGIRQGLVVAGLRPDVQGEAERRFSARAWSDRVRFLPFYGARELSKLVEVYTAASVYFDPSLHEGFGMQVVESMACRTPVVCSDRGALPEVTAGAALFADPSDPEALAAQLIAVLTDPAKSEELAELGSRRARQFSWRRTAEVVHQGLRQAARGR